MTDTTVSPDRTDRGAPGPVRELRLALVCYGGVSLAIYMHGQTKELNRLARGSVAHERDEEPALPSERVWRDLLQEMAQKDPNGVTTRVIIDIIAGTSAGGINGIYLAKALAHDLSQDALRDLWFDRGDIGQLIDAPSWLPKPLKIPYLLARIRKHTPFAVTTWRCGSIRRSRGWSLRTARTGRWCPTTTSFNCSLRSPTSLVTPASYRYKIRR